MKSNYGLGLGMMACLLWFVACGAEEKPKTNLQPDLTLEPLVGIDTTKPLITPEEEAMMSKRLLLPYQENGLWGFADTSGAVVIPAKYEKADAFWENQLTVVKTGEGFGLLNKNGVEVVKPLQPNPIIDCGCGVYGIEQTSGFALINKEGKRIDKGQVQKVMRDCHEDRLAVKIGKTWGYIDSKGKNVVPADMEQVFPFYHGVAPVRKLGQKSWMLIDRNGQPVGSGRFETLYPLTEGLGVGIQTDQAGRSKYGVIDSTGKTIIPFQFARIAGTFSGKFVACAAYDPYDLEAKGVTEAANTWFIYDRQGNKVGETHYGLWDEFSEGLIVAEKSGKFGFADSTGKLVIPFLYDWACAFKNGMAWVQKANRYGFIDKTGKVVIPIQYGSSYDYVFMEDHGAPVEDPVTGEHFYIDHNGKELRKRP
jgi:hypothetical protein